MEHIVQFGINLDDNAIIEAITRQSAEEVKKSLNNMSYGYSGDSLEELVKNEAKRQIQMFVRENEKTIIESAVKEIASRIIKTKVFRESAKDLADKISENLKEGSDDLSTK